MIKYGYTILYVENVQKTIDFYKNAFNFNLKFITPESDYAELETGETVLAFASYDVAKYNDIEIAKSDSIKLPPAFELTFVSNDILNDLKKAIDAGAKLVKEPSSKPWGQIVAYVRDINGFLIELCTPIEK
jgi:lactoylglutathione lyase